MFINHELSHSDMISLCLLGGSAVFALIVALRDEWKTRHPHQ